MNEKPRSLPDDGSIKYRDFDLSKCKGIQVGYATIGGGIRKQCGIGNHRKIKGVLSIDPDRYERFHDTLREAIAFIDNWHGSNNE